MRMSRTGATVGTRCAAAFVGEKYDSEDAEDYGYGDYYGAAAAGIFCAACARREAESGRCQWDVKRKLREALKVLMKQQGGLGCGRICD